MKGFYYLLGGVAVAGIGVLGWQLVGPKSVVIPVDVVVTAADTAGFQGYVIGSDSAPVTIIEFADYQCPGCGQFDTVQWPSVYDQLVATGKVRWIYRDYPLGIHDHARLAAHAAACADDQGKFFPMKARLFAYQRDWSFGGGQLGKFRGYAKSVGVDETAWNACMESTKYAGRIQASHDVAIRLGVQYTPSFQIGSRIYPGGLSSDELRQIVDSVIAARPTTPAAR